MKNLKTLVSVFFITFSVFSQEKEIIQTSYNKKNATIEISNDNVIYKVLQFKKIRKKIETNMEKYVSLKNKQSGSYRLKKVIRIRPINEKFFDENFLLEYWYNRKGESFITIQKVSNDLKLK